MAIRKVFFDANIFNDIFDSNRSLHTVSKKAFALSMEKQFQLFTSCDIATNIYYITEKYTNKENALNALEVVEKIAHIIPFGAKEMRQTIALMREDEAYKDFEDTIQYILAYNTGCDVIISNDKRFVSKELPCMNAESFVRECLS